MEVGFEGAEDWPQRELEVGLEWVGDCSDRGWGVGLKKDWISDQKKLVVGSEGLELGFEEGRGWVLGFVAAVLGECVGRGLGVVSEGVEV